MKIKIFKNVMVKARLSSIYSTISAIGSSGGSLVVTSDCDTAVLGSNPETLPAYSGLLVLRWAAIWDGTSV
jgi:hypothetical protein